MSEREEERTERIINAVVIGFMLIILICTLVGAGIFLCEHAKFSGVPPWDTEERSTEENYNSGVDKLPDVKMIVWAGGGYDER